ncbi:hypothetical protein ACH5RR_025358 [Cinchona calisaya]|uniref:TF-B3 domain-containing protein n=1 Tax=Cinchona calisaya TaxID=153742 RepID=A0ABD2Z001_9GENT
MHLIDILAELAKAKFDEEKKREKKRDQQQQQKKVTMLHDTNPITELEPMTVSKHKRSTRKINKRLAMDFFDVQNVACKYIGHPQEISDHHDYHEDDDEEEEIKKAIPRRKKMKIKKVDDEFDEDYDQIKEKKKKNNFKKNTKVIDFGPFTPPPGLPMEFKNRILIEAESKGGLEIGEEILVIQKALMKTDIESQQNRFSIPMKQMLHEFLDPQEKIFLETRNARMKCNTMEVRIFEPSGKVEKVKFSRWEMTKETGNSSISLVLKGNWQLVVACNHLQPHDIVQLWAVRVGGELCFAFVVLSKQEEDYNNVITNSCDGGDQGVGDGDGEASTSGVAQSI